jgi:type I restriction enzyme S subunit
VNPELLLRHFDRISDAPDAIPQLRRFILELAVRGRLVEQDSNAGSASYVNLNLAKRLRSRGVPEREDSAICPNEIPASWKWQRLEILTDQITDGEHATPPRIDGQQVPLVTAKNVRNGFMDYGDTDWVSFETAQKAWGRCRPIVNDILLVCVGATTGRLCILREPADMVLVRSVALIRPKSTLNVDYLALALRGPVCQAQMWAKVKVTAQPCLYINRIKSLPVPLPPLAEQHCIVAKVDELMALCDLLEAAQGERENRRNRLAAASLRRLNQPADADSPETFREHASFYLNHLPSFTTRPDHIKELRQAILNLAVRGQLVSRDLNEQPASELLDGIDVERARSDPKFTGCESSKPADSDDVPYPIPGHWIWARFARVARIQSNLVDPAKYQNYPHVAPDNIESRTGRLLPYDTIKNSAVFSAKHLFFTGCILYSKIRPALAKVVTVDFDGLCSADMYPIRPFIDRQYLQKYMLSDAFVCQSIAEDTRVAMPKINQAALAKIFVALPPLAEQHRIVAKVDELMALCDHLENQLTTTQTESRRLLGAVLHEALSPMTVDTL